MGVDEKDGTEKSIDPEAGDDVSRNKLDEVAEIIGSEASDVLGDFADAAAEEIPSPQEEDPRASIEESGGDAGVVDGSATGDGGEVADIAPEVDVPEKVKAVLFMLEKQDGHFFTMQDNQLAFEEDKAIKYISELAGFSLPEKIDIVKLFNSRNKNRLGEYEAKLSSANASAANKTAERVKQVVSAGEATPASHEQKVVGDVAEAGDRVVPVEENREDAEVVDGLVTTGGGEVADIATEEDATGTVDEEADPTEPEQGEIESNPNANDATPEVPTGQPVREVTPSPAVGENNGQVDQTEGQPTESDQFITALQAALDFKGRMETDLNYSVLNEAAASWRRHNFKELMKKLSLIAGVSLAISGVVLTLLFPQIPHANVILFASGGSLLAGAGVYMKGAIKEELYGYDPKKRKEMQSKIAWTDALTGQAKKLWEGYQPYMTDRQKTDILRMLNQFRQAPTDRAGLNYSGVPV